MSVVPEHCSEEGAELEAKILNLYLSYVLAHTFGHYLWVVTERMWIQAAVMSSLREWAGGGLGVGTSVGSLD